MSFPQINPNGLEIASYVRPEKATCKQTADWVVFRIWNAIKAIFGQSVWQKTKKELVKGMVNAGMSKYVAEPTIEASLRVAVEAIRGIKSGTAQIPDSMGSLFGGGTSGRPSLSGLLG